VVKQKQIKEQKRNQPAVSVTIKGSDTALPLAKKKLKN
jgi:hypothetical protein